MDYELGDDDGRNDDGDTGPTFEDLAIDDSLSDLDRVTKYVCSNIALQRVIHVKMLEETAMAVGFEAACDRLIPLLEPLVWDEEYVVRQHVAFQFPPLCRFLVTANADAGYRVLLDKMIPLITKLLTDDQHEVRSAAGDSLVEMAALVKPEDQGQHILTIVLPLAHDDDHEHLRIAAVGLYNGLAEHLGPELCQQFCVPELISLSEDPVFRVRKSTAQSFSNVCKIAGQEVSKERLLPAFMRLAKDDIWGVRKACAESLVSISEALAPSERGALLVPLVESFVQDSSRWVRIATYQNLGPLLSTLDPNDVSDTLLTHYLNMASTTSATQLGGGSGEVDIKFHCAFSFPAIVQMVGPDQWSKLSPTFETLSNDAFWKIRRTFAYSLHEIARIVGQEITETQLATAFDAYLHDVHDVKLGAMRHFADFLQHVSPSFRESYLPVLSSLDQSTTKWRFREVVCLQLDQLCQIFTPEATFSVIYPLVFKLMTDDVAVVRQESFHACPLLLARVSHKNEWKEEILNHFCSLAQSKRYTERQIYLKICEAFLLATDETSRSIFTTALAPLFFTLGCDPVSNVRHLYAEMVRQHQDLLVTQRSCPKHLRDLLSSFGDCAYTTDELMVKLYEQQPYATVCEDDESGDPPTQQEQQMDRSSSALEVEPVA